MCENIYVHYYEIDTIRACIKSYPWASTVAMLLDSNLISFLRFQIVREQSVINAFSIYVISPCGYVVCLIRRIFHHSGLAFPQCLERHLWRGRYCKITYFSFSVQIFHKLFSQKFIVCAHRFRYAQSEEWKVKSEKYKLLFPDHGLHRKQDWRVEDWKVLTQMVRDCKGSRRNKYSFIVNVVNIDH